jgi:hypothetical protein
LRDRILALAGLAGVLLLLVAGCASTTGVESGNPDGIHPGGLVRPNTFLTYDGQRYQLVQLVLAEQVSESEFREVGVTRNADIDFDDALHLFERQGDREALYTFAPDSDDDVAYWLRWQRRG